MVCVAKSPPFHPLHRATQGDDAVIHGPSLRVTVVSPGAPQLDQLAAVLASRGHLASLIHPYLRTGSRVERALEAAPIAGKRVRRELHRRSLVDIDPALLRLVGTRSEFGRAMLSRGPFLRFDISKRIASWCMWRTNRLLSKEAIDGSRGSDILVAPYGVAHAAFRSRDVRALKVLDYPIAHHEFARRILAEEATLRPEFAGTLQFHRWPEWVTRRWDEECDAADLILVGSRFAMDSFVAQGFTREKLAVVPYGVDVQLFSPPQDAPGRFRALFVGQVGQRKGIGYLADGWAIARGMGLPVNSELILAGSYIGDAGRALASGESFRHIPSVSRLALPAIYRSASVLILPSLIEGMPLVVLEAMACGLPVVVTPAAAGEVVRDGVEGFVVPPRDSRTIAERLLTLSTDHEMRRQMGLAARRRALEYTWQAYGDRVLREMTARMSEKRRWSGHSDW